MKKPGSNSYTPKKPFENAPLKAGYKSNKPAISMYSVEVANPETIFLVLTQSLTNPWIAGVLFAVVLSAILSTIDSQFLVSTSVISDIVQSFDRRGRIPTKFVLNGGRYLVVGLLVVAYLIAMTPENTILSLVSYAWAGLGCAFGPVLLLSLFWKRMTSEGAIVGIIFGSLFVLVFGLNGKLMDMAGLFDLYPALSGAFSNGFFGVYELLPGFFIVGLLVIGVSLITKSPGRNNG